MKEGPRRPASAHDSGHGETAVLIEAGPARFVGDLDRARGGLDLGPTPHEIVAAALAACTAQTLRLYAARKGWPLGETTVEVISVTDEAETPAERFERAIRLGGPLDEMQRARLLEIAEMCPIHRLLTRGASVSTTVLPAAEAV